MKKKKIKKFVQFFDEKLFAKMIYIGSKDEYMTHVK